MTDVELIGCVVYIALHTYTVRSGVVASDAVCKYVHVRASRVAGAESAPIAARTRTIDGSLLTLLASLLVDHVPE